MQFQDVKPTAFSDPSSHWRNETNAYDGNLTTFADNQPKPKIPNYVQFCGQTINLGVNKAIFCIRLSLKLGTTGFVNDAWEVKLINGATTRRLWNGIVSITDPTTFEWEAFSNLPTGIGKLNLNPTCITILNRNGNLINIAYFLEEVSCGCITCGAKAKSVFVLPPV